MHRALKLLASAAAMLALCAPALAGSANLPNQRDPQGCGTIVLPVGGGDGPSADITSFSPLFSDTAYNQQIGWMLYPDLLWINRFSQIDWSRSLATSVTTTDNQSFLITMRPWNWSDGVPVSAGDVAYGFKLAKALGPIWPGYGGGGLPDIVQSITVLDPMHLRIVTTHKVNPEWFIFNAISGLAPLPKHVWKKYTLDQMYQLQSSPSFYSVVDGEVKVQSIAFGQDLVLVPNPAWQGPKLHFSRLVFSFLQGDGPGIMAVRSGDVDAADVPNNLYSLVQHLPGFHIEILPQSYTQDVINLNFQNPKVAFFRDVRVRQAMIDAINQQQIVNLVEHGNGDAAYGPVPRSMGAFLSPQMRKGIYPVGYDPEKAKALLAQAGWAPGPDGIMRKDGKRLSFTFLLEAGSNSTQEADEMMQQMLRHVGIEMKFQTIDFNQMLQLMATSPTGWEAAGDGETANTYPTGEGSYATGANQNMGGYSDPEMDRLIEASTDQPGLDNLFAYEAYASAQLPVIFTPRTRPVILVSNRLHGMTDFLNPIGMLAADQLYCTAPKGEVQK